MNSRRLIVAPEAQIRNGSNLRQRSGGGRLPGRTQCPLWAKSGHVLVQTVMSALPPKADMCAATTDVRFGPIADIRRAPIAERPYYPQASELLARVPRSVLDLLDDLIKVPALGAL